MLEFLLPLRVRKKQTERLDRISHGPGSAHECMPLYSAVRKSQVESVMAAKNFGEGMAPQGKTIRPPRDVLYPIHQDQTAH
jgi:hypothetical protein